MNLELDFRRRGYLVTRTVTLLFWSILMFSIANSNLGYGLVLSAITAPMVLVVVASVSDFVRTDGDVLVVRTTGRLWRITAAEIDRIEKSEGFIPRAVALLSSGERVPLGVIEYGQYRSVTEQAERRLELLRAWHAGHRETDGEARPDGSTDSGLTIYRVPTIAARRQVVWMTLLTISVAVALVVLPLNTIGGLVGWVFLAVAVFGAVWALPLWLSPPTLELGDTGLTVSRLTLRGGGRVTHPWHAVSTFDLIDVKRGRHVIPAISYTLEPAAEDEGARSRDRVLGTYGQDPAKLVAELNRRREAARAA